MKKKLLPIVFSSTLALFMAMLLLVASICEYALNTICDPQVLISSGEESTYTQEVYEQIRDNWENLLAITGVMDPDPIMAVLTQRQVHEDAIGYLQNAYAGISDLDTTAMKTQLEEKIRDYTFSNNIYSTSEEELERNITDLVNACMDEYHRAVRIPLLPRLLSAVSRMAGYLKICGWIVAGIAVVLLVFLFFLQRKRTETLYYLAIAIGTDAILLLGLTALAKGYHVIERLPVSESALKTLLIAYLQPLLDRLQFAGYVFLMVTVVVLAVYLLLTLLVNKHKAAAEKPTTQT